MNSNDGKPDAPSASTVPSGPDARIVKCPRCRKSTEYSPRNEFRPFCSQRCRTTDLGDWAEGRHAIPVESEALTEEEREMLAGHLEGELAGHVAGHASEEDRED